MSGHTPGPWFVQPFFLTIYNLSAGHSGATCAIAKALREQPGDEQAHFNAFLIAAAPDLLAACKDMLAGWQYIREHHGDLYGVGWDRCEEAARAAIAKAEQP